MDCLFRVFQVVLFYAVVTEAKIEFLESAAESTDDVTDHGSATTVISPTTDAPSATTSTNKTTDVVSLLCPNATSILKALPGSGWDNLRNAQLKPIFFSNYSSCRLILLRGEERLLVPDQLEITAVEGREEVRGVMFPHWTSFVSSDASSLNQQGDSLFGSAGVSGTFNADFQRVKERRVKDNAITARTEVRLVLYAAEVTSSSPLDPDLQDKVRHIADALHSNQTRCARYHAQLLVREYGTHFVEQVQIGAAIAKEDSLSRSALGLNGTSPVIDQSHVLTTATELFFGPDGVDLSPSGTNGGETAEQKKYLEARLSKELYFKGGDLEPSKETSIRDWLQSASHNPAVVQRDGKPLYELITQVHFPQLAEETREEIRTAVHDAIVEYYAQNVHLGCTNLQSANFSFGANQDDGTCHELRRPFRFGGVYQTCTPLNEDAADLCSGLEVNNTMGGNLSCVSGYQSSFLYSSNVTTSRVEKTCEKKCSGFWIFKKCNDDCSDRTVQHTVQYSVHWCAKHDDDHDADATGHEDDPLEFGGVYSSVGFNALTNGPSCPPHFSPINLAGNVTVCVARRNDDTKDVSLFGGMYTCKEGNPLSGQPNDTGSVQVEVTGGVIRRVVGPPRHCPAGYSTYKVPTGDGDCNVFYCIRNTAFNKNYTPPAIVSPPFFAAPDSCVITDSITTTTAKSVSVTSKFGKYVDDSSGTDVVAGVTISAFMIAIIVAILAAFYVRKRVERKKEEDREHEPLVD